MTSQLYSVFIHVLTYLFITKIINYLLASLHYLFTYLFIYY